LNLFLLGAAALLLSNCGEPQVVTGAADTLVISSDPELRTAVEELLPDLAARSGLELRAPVHVERRSRAELERYLAAKLDEELGAEEEDQMLRSYSLLGLMRRDLDLRGLLLEVYAEQIAGFYDPDSTALFVMDDQPTETLTTVLVHELVHAVQDQSTDLDSLTSKDRGNDRRVAAQAAIEGHATLVMIEYMMERLQGSALDLSDIPDFAGLLRPALETIRAQYPALGTAPRVVQESILFPYLEGAGFVQALWRSEDTRPAPFGDRLPESTEQVVDPQRLLGPSPDFPTSVDVSVDQGAVVYETTLGQLETRILLEELSGPAAGAAATGWDGDHLILIETTDGSDALAWVAVWDDVGARDRFIDTLGGGIDRLPARASLAPLEVAGRPVSVLRVGTVGEVTVDLGSD
jgi:hypothetical protein